MLPVEKKPVGKEPTAEERLIHLEQELVILKAKLVMLQIELGGRKEVNVNVYNDNPYSPAKFGLGEVTC